MGVRRNLAMAFGLAALAACSGSPATDDNPAEEAAAIDLTAITVADPACPMLNQMRAWPAPPGDGLIDPVSNRIALLPDDQIDWNGEAITFRTLTQFLEITTQMAPQPHLKVGIDPADNCDRVRILVDTIEELVDCSSETCVLDYRDD